MSTYWKPFIAIRFMVIFVTTISLTGCAISSSTLHKKADLPDHDLLALRVDVAPLFVLGDLNEDLTIDATDRKLLIELVSSDGASNDVSLTCASAGDLTLDGDFTDEDVAAMDQILEQEELSSLPLYYQPHGTCQYRNRMFASVKEAEIGGIVPVRLLGDLDVGEVSLRLDGVGEIVEATDGRGWDIQIPETLEPEDSIFVLIATLAGQDYSYTLRADPPAVTPTVPGDTTWIDAANPAGSPPSRTAPPVWGSSIDSLALCPQEKKGCEALLIDFAKASYIDADSDATKAALTQVGCNVVYAAPSFVSVPTPTTLYLRAGAGGVRKVTIRPSISSVNRAKAKNRRAWATVRSAVSTHRTNVARGVSLAIQHVNGHGGQAGCGNWGPGFTTGTGTLNRRDFHHGNYSATRGNVCNTVAEDWSCYSGNTPKLINELNNTGTTACASNSPSKNHGHHAGFYGDMSISSAPDDKKCTNGEILLRDLGSAAMISRYGRYKNWLKLGDGYRQEIVDEDTPPSGIGADGKYSDRGYNKTPGNFCENASHVSAF